MKPMIDKTAEGVDVEHKFYPLEAIVDLKYKMTCLYGQHGIREIEWYFVPRIGDTLIFYDNYPNDDFFAGEYVVKNVHLGVENGEIHLLLEMVISYES